MNEKKQIRLTLLALGLVFIILYGGVIIYIWSMDWMKVGTKIMGTVVLSAWGFGMFTGLASTYKV